jgi:signal transduction histidine kinase
MAPVSGSGTSAGPHSRFREWAESIDPAMRRSLQWPLGWIVAVVGYSALLTLVARVPSLRSFFGLEPRPLLVLQVVALGFTLAVYRRENAGGFSSLQRGVCVLVIAFLLQLVFSATVALSAPPGRYVFAALPLIAIWLHSAAIGGSWRYPFPLLAHAAAMAVALALRPDSSDFVVFATMAPLGLAGGLLSGTLTAELSGQRAALERHRSAIWAQVLAARAEEVDRLSEHLRSAARLRSDGERARQAALGAALAIASHGEDPARRAALATLDDSLRALVRSAEEIRELGRESPPSSEGARAVHVLPRARETVARLAQRFPHVTLECRAASPRAESALAAVGGGEEGLRRILDAALTNACEGDGAAGASRVELLVADEPRLRVLTIEVRDDGPGFPPDLLARPIAPFVTTKPGASGLGLYTAERLARAGGGFLRRENGAGGGARLTVFLPEAAPT